MSAVIWLVVEVTAIDIGALFYFVSNNILLSKLGKHGLSETRISMKNLFPNSVM